MRSKIFSGIHLIVILVLPLLLSISSVYPSHARAILADQTGNLPTLNEATLAQFHNYRIRLTFRYVAQDKSGDLHNEQIVVIREVDNLSGNRHFSFESTDLSTQDHQIQGYLHADQLSYAYAIPRPDSFSADCVLIANESAYSDYTQLFNPSIYLGSVSQATLKSRGERINGVLTDRYQIRQVRFGNFTSLSGTIWVAQRGGFVVRYSGQATGATQVILAPMQGNFSWDYSVEAINALPTISVPDVCISQQVEMNIPIPSNAQIQINQPDFIGFVSSDDPATIIDFYQRTLPNNGWEILPSSGEVPEGWMFSVTNGNQSYYIMIMSNQTGGTMVIIAKV